MASRRTSTGFGLVLSLAIALLCAGVEPPEQAPQVNFTFDQVDIRAFVKVVGEMTGQSFIVDQGVEGKITVMTPPIAVDQVYPLFVSVLESAGCSVVREGNLTRVVALPPRATPSAPLVPPGTNVSIGLITKVIHLQHVSASEVKKMLESKISGGKAGAVSALETTNHLIVTDTAESIRWIEQILAEIDKPGLARVTEVVRLQFVSAEEIAAQVMLAIMGGDKAVDALVRRLPKLPDAGGEKDRSIVVVPAPHSNSLILVGSAVDVAAAKELIALMDVENTVGRGRLHAIFLKYLAADEAAKSLNSLLDKTVEKKGDQSAARKIAIEASVANNALLVEAAPRDFELIQELVASLDQVPEQVLIEVLIAEASVNDELDIGVEMAAVDMPSDFGDTVVQGSSKVEDTTALMNAVQQGVFPRGITVGVARRSGIDASGKPVMGYPAFVSLNAVRKNGKFKILSNIPLLAQNNKEASASVVNNIPMLKSTIQGGSGTARDVIQNIERVDVGIKLKLTPHINPDAQVRMVLNPSIEAIVDPGTSGTQFTPTIARREVTTTVTVPDGNTIVISGLIRDDERKIVRKIPLLGSIPLLGVLFRRTVDSRERTNLLIFVTPHIVTEAGAAELWKKKWEAATGISSTNSVGGTPDR